MSLEIASQAAAVATLPFQAAPVCAATAVTAGLWVKSRHPDARIESWMQRIDPVMKAVESRLNDIPYEELDVFASIVNDFFEQKSYLEEKHNGNPIFSWYRKKKDGDELAAFGHKVVRYGLTISNAASLIAIECRTKHADADRAGGHCIKCLPEGRGGRERLTGVIFTWADLRKYSPPPAPPKKSFFGKKKASASSSPTSKGSQAPLSSGTSPIIEHHGCVYPVDGPSNLRSPQASTSSKAEHLALSHSQGKRKNTEQDALPTVSQPEDSNQLPYYSKTEIEVHDKARDNSSHTPGSSSIPTAEEDYGLGRSGPSSSQASTFENTRQSTLSDSQGHCQSAEQDSHPTLSHPKGFDLLPGYSITRIEVHEQADDVQSEPVSPPSQADSAVDHERPIFQVPAPLHTIYIFHDNFETEELRPWQSAASLLRKKRENCVPNEWLH